MIDTRETEERLQRRAIGNARFHVTVRDDWRPAAPGLTWPQLAFIIAFLAWLCFIVIR